jgi:hypothetical protein
MAYAGSPEASNDTDFFPTGRHDPLIPVHLWRRRECGVMDGTKANFEVFELSSTGNMERLLARLTVFDDAKMMADLAKSKSRVVVHFGEVIWPRPERGSAQAPSQNRRNKSAPAGVNRTKVPLSCIARAS